MRKVIYRKTSVPIADLHADAPGPVTFWSQMSDEKRAEIRALYENRPNQRIGLAPPPDPELARRVRQRTRAKLKLSAHATKLLRAVALSE